MPRRNLIRRYQKSLAMALPQDLRRRMVLPISLNGRHRLHQRQPLPALVHLPSQRIVVQSWHLHLKRRLKALPRAKHHLRYPSKSTQLTNFFGGLFLPFTSLLASLDPRLSGEFGQKPGIHQGQVLQPAEQICYPITETYLLPLLLDLRKVYLFPQGQVAVIVLMSTQMFLDRISPLRHTNRPERAKKRRAPPAPRK